jgi:thermitase
MKYFSFYLKTIAFLVASLNTNICFSQEAQAIPGQYIIKFKDKKSFNNTIFSTKENILKTLPSHNAILIERSILQTEESIKLEFTKNINVKWIEPNIVFKIQKTPNDPLWPQLWGLHGTNDSDIEADKAWEISTGSQNVIVAVIDTGVYYNSPEFNGNIWTNNDELNGKAGIDDDNNGFIDDIYGWNFVSNNSTPIDDNGHGTHVSGTIGARGNDNFGLVGVAWNVQIMALKAYKADGNGDAVTSASAVDYAVKMGAKIINASWASAVPSQLLQESIEKARDKGVLFVACAGNTARDNDSKPIYPASYDIENIISVAAITKDGALAPFSSYGQRSVHVAAPGVDILSITPNGYQQLSGTSMAAPHVSGIAVLLLAAEPKLTFIDLKKRILETAKPLVGLKYRIKTGAEADAYRALAKIISPLDPENPAGWIQKIDLNISTPHPYSENKTYEYEVQIPGAKRFSLYFKKFDSEQKYDKLTFLDRSNKVLDEIEGINSDTWTSIFPGDYVKLVFTSDKSNNDYGFDLTKATYQ